MTIEPSDFTFLKGYVHQQAAIVLEAGKEYLVESRLGPLAKQHGFASISEMVGRVRVDKRARIGVEIVEALTTNETSFFRDVTPFETLKNVVLPGLLTARKASRRLRIWSAACSTGQEPYSIAMILRDCFPELQAWDVRILATDLTTSVLERARAGRFRQLEVNRGLPAALLVKYFQKAGTDWEVIPVIRNMIDFKQLNLSEDWSVGEFDVVFMRNVLIYFDVATKKQILGRVRRCLPREGALFLGGAETTLNLDDGFERVHTAGGAYYRKRA